MIRRLLALKLPLSWRQWCKQMIYIKKGTEPSSLKEYRSQPNATYEGFRDKDDIRKALLKEQGCLCAYCMSRITKENMKIEHWSPQNPEDGDGEAKALDYQNMLGVCTGNMASPFENQTCDTHKKNTTIRVNPLSQESVAQIAYRADGTIYSENVAIDRDLNETLNLNCERTYLKANRKAAIAALQKFCLEQKRNGTWNLSVLKKAEQEFGREKEGKKTPYLGAILFFIDRYSRKIQ